MAKLNGFSRQQKVSFRYPTQLELIALLEGITPKQNLRNPFYEKWLNYFCQNIETINSVQLVNIAGMKSPDLTESLTI